MLVMAGGGNRRHFSFCRTRVGRTGAAAGGVYVEIMMTTPGLMSVTFALQQAKLRLLRFGKNRGQAHAGATNKHPFGQRCSWRGSGSRSGAENGDQADSTEVEDFAIEELLVVENAQENGGNRLQQPSTQGLAFRVAQAEHAVEIVGNSDFALQGWAFPLVWCGFGFLRTAKIGRKGLTCMAPQDFFVAGRKSMLARRDRKAAALGDVMHEPVRS